MVKHIRFLIISILFLLAFIINTSLSLAASDCIWPVKGEIITPFSFDISNYYASGQHRGIDIKGSVGTEIYAPLDGKIIWKSGNAFGSGGGGISIDHANDMSSTYLGIRDIKVKTGEHISKGTTIAFIGDKGDSSSASEPHLHFAMYRTSSRSDQKTEYFNPVNFLGNLSVNDDELNLNESSVELTSPQKSEFTDATLPVTANNTILIKEPENIKTSVIETKLEKKPLSSRNSPLNMSKSNNEPVYIKSASSKHNRPLINNKITVNKSSNNVNLLKETSNPKSLRKINRTTNTNLYNQLLNNYVRSVSKNSFNENQSENINRLFIPIIALVSLILLRSQSLITMKPHFARLATV